MAAPRVAVSFTGGKDSTAVLTLLQLLQQGRIGGTHAGHAASSGEDAQLQLPPGLLENLQRDFPDVQQQEIVLVTFAPEGNKPFKAHPLQVIQAQAQALGLRHITKTISGPDFLASYVAALQGLKEELGVGLLATGDILDVCQDFMGRACRAAGMPIARPLWGMPRLQLLQLLWDLRIRPLITCINAHKFSGQAPEQQQEAEGAVCRPGPSAPASAAGAQGGSGDGDAAGGRAAAVALVGQELTQQLVADMLGPLCEKLGLDVCGEWGEMHTMCIDGPTWKSRLVLKGSVGGVGESEGGEFAWLVPGEVTLEPKEV